MYTACTSWDRQWNLSIMALRTKDTSIIQTAIDGPKWSAIETCTYLTSEIRTPLYSVLLTHDPAPNGHNAQLTNSIIWSGPRPWVTSLAIALQFHMDHHEDGWFTRPKHQISGYHSLSDLLRPSFACFSSFSDARWLRGVACKTMHTCNQPPN